MSQGQRWVTKGLAFGAFVGAAHLLKGGMNPSGFGLFCLSFVLFAAAVRNPRRTGGTGLVLLCFILLFAGLALVATRIGGGLPGLALMAVSIVTFVGHLASVSRG